MAKQQLTGAGIQCGRNVILGLCGIGGAGFIIGWLIEHSAMVFRAINRAWEFALDLASLGGGFWGAVGLGMLMMSVVAWAFCVGDKLSKEEFEKNCVWLVRSGISAGIVWLLSYCSMQHAFTSMSDLTSYRVIGVIVMSLPFVAAFFGALAGMLAIASDA